MGDKELDSFTSNLPSWVRIFIDYSPNQRHGSVLLERISLDYIVAVMQEQCCTFRQYIAGDINDSEILKHYPELRSRIDKDGLLPVGDDLRLFDGGIEYRDHVLYYHQFLRRGYASNPNFDFLGRFLRYYINTKKQTISV